MWCCSNPSEFVNAKNYCKVRGFFVGNAYKRDFHCQLENLEKGEECRGFNPKYAGIQYCPFWPVFNDHFLCLCSVEHLFFSNYWFILFLSSDTNPYNHACSVILYSELTANYTHALLLCVLGLFFFFFLSRNSSSLKMFTSRTRRIFRAMWTEWSRTLGNWNLKSRTMQTRVRTFTQHIDTPGTSTFIPSFNQLIFFNVQGLSVLSSASPRLTFVNSLHSPSLLHSLSFLMLSPQKCCVSALSGGFSNGIIGFLLLPH